MLRGHNLGPIATFLALFGLVSPTTFKDVLPEVYHSCCTDKITSCGPIEAAVRGGADGEFYVFHRSYYTTFDQVGRSGEPILSKVPAYITKDWPNQSGKDVLLTAVKREGKIQLIDQYQKRVYTSKKQFVEDRLITCSDTVASDKLLCDPKNTGQVDNVMITSRGKGQKPLVFAWYRQLESKRQDRYVFDGDHGAQLNFTTEVKPFITRETLIYFDNGQVAHGFDFLDDSRVLPFTLKSGEYDFRPFEVAQGHPGIASQLFLGCPQAFCYNTDVDAANYLQDQDIIVLYRGQYYWKMSGSSGLPLMLPEAHQALLIDDNLMSGHPKYIDSLIAFDNRIYIAKGEQYWWYIGGKKVGTGRISHLFRGLPEGTKGIDAVWQNRKENKFYVFYRGLYSVFSYDTKTERFMGLEPFNRKIANFKGFPKLGIDAVVSVMEETSYFLKRNWYFKVQDTTWSTAQHVPIFTLGLTEAAQPFFKATKCGYTDSQYRELRETFERDYKLTPAASSDTDDESTPPDDPAEQKQPEATKRIVTMVLIVAAAVGFAFVAIIAVFFIVVKRKKVVKGRLLNSESVTKSSLKNSPNSGASIVTVNSNGVS